MGISLIAQLALDASPGCSVLGETYPRLELGQNNLGKGRSHVNKKSTEDLYFRPRKYLGVSGISPCGMNKAVQRE